jgi:hypothetical protein
VSQQLTEAIRQREEAYKSGLPGVGGALLDYAAVVPARRPNPISSEWGGSWHGRLGRVAGRADATDVLNPQAYGIESSTGGMKLETPRLDQNRDGEGVSFNTVKLFTLLDLKI